MGSPKLLLPWRGTTVISHLIHQWQQLGATQIVVVVRPNDVPLSGELDRLQFPASDRIDNPAPDHGMFSSIICASRWSGWQADVVSILVALGDQPHLGVETLRQLLGFHAMNAGSVCQPEFEGRPRHPVIMPRQIFDKLKTSAAATLKDFLGGGSIARSYCPLKDPGLSLDMDTTEDYKRLKVF